MHAVWPHGRIIQKKQHKIKLQGGRFKANKRQSFIKRVIKFWSLLPAVLWMPKIDFKKLFHKVANRSIRYY